MRRKTRITLFVLLTTLFTSIFLCAQNWVSLALAGQLPEFKTRDELIDEISYAHRIDARIVRAIIRVESADGKALNRFEQATFNKRSDRNASQFDKWALSTSHGLMHVMGFNAKWCGLSWYELYNDKKNLTCGIALLKDCLDKKKGDVTKALGCYNGDPVAYPVKVKVALADIELNK